MTLKERFAADNARPKLMDGSFPGDQYEFPDPQPKFYTVTNLEDDNLYLLDFTWHNNPLGVFSAQCATRSDEGWIFHPQP